MSAGNGPESTGNASDRLLMAQVRDGDPEALDRLIQRYWGSLLQFAYGFTSSQDEAEDIVQETFVRIWRSRSTWRSTGTVRSYLFTISRNLCLHREERRQVRDGWRDREQLRPRRAPSPLAHLEANEVLAALNQALEELPPRRREVFRLVCLQGLSYREAAQVMEVAVPTVANQMSAALASLREAVGPITESV